MSSQQNGSNFQSTNPISILGVDGLYSRIAKQILREEYKGTTTVDKRIEQLQPFKADIIEALKTGNFEKISQSTPGSSSSIARIVAKRLLTWRNVPQGTEFSTFFENVKAEVLEILEQGALPKGEKSHAFASSAGNFGYYVKEAARRINKVAELKGYNEDQKLRIVEKVFSDAPVEVLNQISKLKRFGDLLSDDEIDTEFADVEDDVLSEGRVAQTQKPKKGKK